MQLLLVDRNKEFCEAARSQFRKHPEVQIVCGRFEDLPSYDCVLTAGNSFGLMDAGMDLAVVRYFGRQVMERIQKQIIDDHLGEQPVGTCIIVPTDHSAHPFVSHSPTMRIPMNIQGTDHVYLAMWAALTAIHRHNRSQSLPWLVPVSVLELAVWILPKRHFRCVWLTITFCNHRSFSIHRSRKSGMKEYITADVGDSLSLEKLRTSLHST